MPKKIIDVATKTITFSFPEKAVKTKTTDSNGKEVEVFTPGEGFEPRVFHLAKVEGLGDVDTLPDFLVRTALHGISQKVGDNYANAKEVATETGTDPVQWCRDQIDLMIGQLYTGKWNAVRTGGGGAGGRATILVLAFAQVAGCSEDEAIEHVEGLDEKEQKELAKKPKVKAAILQIQAQRAVARAEAAAKAAAAVDAPKAEG